jgi:Myb-like DNA-binding domain
MDISEYLRQQFKESGNQQFHIEGDIWLVPCVANYSQNDFKPLLKPLSCNYISEQQNSKQGWTPIEEEILLKIVLSRGAKAWSAIAKELNAMIHDCNPVRQGRHCRERWYNHVDPNLKKSKWTEEEDRFILEQQLLLGNRWSEISKKMQGRTENSVKNRFKSLKRRNIGIEGKDYQTKQESNEKESEIQAQSPNFNTLLLMSPQIINYDFHESFEPINPCENFVKPSPIIMRVIKDKLPSIQRISEAKEKLKRELMIEGTPSPSAFLNLRG